MRSILLLILLITASCSTYHQPMETVVRDSLYITHRMIDRVLIRDSVFERHVHDTIYRYRERETVRYLSLRDTVYIEKVDSVSVPIPVKQGLSSKDRLKLLFSNIAAIFSSLALIAFLILFRNRIN
ncbi:MAG: hypothetical protein PUC85_10880 [bacterium]|nr:hypothetical protein [bacterium]